MRRELIKRRAVVSVRRGSHKARKRKRTAGKAMSGGGREMGRKIQGSQLILSNI